MVRVKYRYLVVNLLFPAPAGAAVAKAAPPELLQFHAPMPDDFHAGQLMRAVKDGISELFGDYGLGLIGSSLKVNYWSPATSTAIIRCPRSHYQMVWAALTFMTQLPKIGTPVVAKIVRVSGTIRKAEEDVIRRSEQLIRRAKLVNGCDENDRAILEGVEKSVQRRENEEGAALAHIDEPSDEESD